jgi:hypothetical protein
VSAKKKSPRTGRSIAVRAEEETPQVPEVIVPTVQCPSCVGGAAVEEQSLRLGVRWKIPFLGRVVLDFARFFRRPAG